MAKYTHGGHRKGAGRKKGVPKKTFSVNVEVSILESARENHGIELSQKVVNFITRLSELKPEHHGKD